MAQLPPGFPGISPPPPPPSWLFSPSLPLRPPPPPPPQGKIIVGIIIAVATSLVVFIAVWAVCREYRHRRARAMAIAADTGARPSPEHGSGDVEERPLRQAYAASTAADFPALVYSRSVKHNLAGAGEEAATCSVCLGEFQLGETVRLLPVCLHLYHAECIDPWLEAHSTCPLCRSDTDPATGMGRLLHV
ncbi:hypothetical protein QYE76_034056 [Lolium multiflorum]|uniref:RING-type E3 ubiquitin transferase n=1 Tax=Lolium multiflorum TaxID=4521 RepID=A0AAD8VMY1_LOLMU|nr:hypothetical protein QYE76_034056 [Lolium multiflorum]